MAGESTESIDICAPSSPAIRAGNNNHSNATNILQAAHHVPITKEFPSKPEARNSIDVITQCTTEAENIPLHCQDYPQQKTSTKTSPRIVIAGSPGTSPSNCKSHVRTAAGIAEAQQQQLAEISRVLWPDKPPKLPSTSQITAEIVSLKQELESTKVQLQATMAATNDQKLAARLAASICTRVACTADLNEAWSSEMALLQGRLEQAARMGEAMLRHKREHGRTEEPLRHQLVQGVIAVGFTVVGAAAAVVIIKGLNQRGGSAYHFSS